MAWLLSPTSRTSAVPAPALPIPHHARFAMINNDILRHALQQTDWNSLHELLRTYHFSQDDRRYALVQTLAVHLASASVRKSDSPTMFIKNKLQDVLVDILSDPKLYSSARATNSQRANAQWATVSRLAFDDCECRRLIIWASSNNSTWYSLPSHWLT